MPQISFSLLGFTVFAYFPLAALMPRGMTVFVILTALAMLPLGKRLFSTLADKGLRLPLLGLVLAAVYSAASALWSPSTKAATASIDLAYISLCGTLILPALSLMDDTQRQKLHTALLCGFVLGMVFLGIEMGLNFPLHRTFSHIVGPVPVEENVPKRIAALWALGVWPVALLLEQRGRRLLALALILGMVVGHLGFTNRSSLLGLALASAVFLMARRNAALMRAGLMAMLVVGLVLVVPVFTSLPKGPGPATQMLFDSANHRIKIWTLTAEHVKEAPLFGHGIDSSRGIKSTVDDSGVPYIKSGVYSVALHPHNIFLQLWLDFGLVGTLLWGGLMLMLARATRRLPEIAQPYALAAIVCSLVMLNTTYSILQAWWAGGHIGAAALLLLASYNFSRRAVTSGTSAGGMA